MNTKPRTTAFLLGSIALLCALGSAQAQTVYRIVGPDGKVTFSDKPPASAEQGKVAATAAGAVAASGGANLPFELRQIVSKYPVVLYTGSQCAPCDTGRALLTSRGVPFNERTITTNEDGVSFQRLTGDASLPYLTIGGQRIKGFSDAEWSQYLDAAGYPKASILPAGYKNSAATPLVAVQAATPASKPAEKPAAAPSEPAYESPPPRNPSNPAGIQF